MRFTITLCFSRQPICRIMAMGIITEKDFDLPTLVIFLIEFIGLAITHELTQ